MLIRSQPWTTPSKGGFGGDQASRLASLANTETVNFFPQGQALVNQLPIHPTKSWYSIFFNFLFNFFKNKKVCKVTDR